MKPKISGYFYASFLAGFLAISSQASAASVTGDAALKSDKAQQHQDSADSEIFVMGNATKPQESGGSSNKSLSTVFLTYMNNASMKQQTFNTGRPISSWVCSHSGDNSYASKPDKYWMGQSGGNWTVTISNSNSKSTQLNVTCTQIPL
ncbi:hypothetical protein [Vibrio fluvialis]|uniref:hypothetical protein n=1 Tax=Vibrio fluvialis TaxID=676 RepID=UPI00192AF31E|nr:hypothetical protein [Vibrio fluvialis]MBL4262808.1 hypothetical protein [Vibrio fluvialis]